MEGAVGVLREQRGDARRYGIALGGDAEQARHLVHRLAQVGGDDVNVPGTLEVSYSFTPTLLVGAQLSVDVWRESPVLGSAGVRWKFAEDWLLSVWFPRPRIEFNATDAITLYAGANLSASTFRVSSDFGNGLGRPDLNGQRVEYRQIQVGGGVRYSLKNKLGIELAGGWTVERRYEFNRRNAELDVNGSPYVQLAFGLQF